MGFMANFVGILTILMLLPIWMIILPIQKSTESCIENIPEELPNAMQGDSVEMKKVTNESCNTNKGGFQFGKVMANLVNKYYVSWLLISVIISLTIALYLEDHHH
jgi:ABC-type glycerol-3-phosphate transport system permease component